MAKASKTSTIKSPRRFTPPVTRAQKPQRITRSRGGSATAQQLAESLSLFLLSGIYIIPDEKVVALRHALMEFGPLRKFTSEDLAEIRDVLIASFSDASDSETTLEQENVFLKQTLKEKEDLAQHILRQAHCIEEESAILRSRDTQNQDRISKFETQFTILNQLNRDTESVYRGNKKELEDYRSRLQRERSSYDDDMAKKEIELQELKEKVGDLEKDSKNLRSHSVQSERLTLELEQGLTKVTAELERKESSCAKLQKELSVMRAERLKSAENLIMCEQKLRQLEDSYQREKKGWMSRNSNLESSIRELRDKERISNQAITNLQKEQLAALTKSSKVLAESKSLNTDLRGENERLMEELATMEAQSSAFTATGTESLAYEMFGSGQPEENNGGKVSFDDGTSGLKNSRLLQATRQFNCANVQTDSPTVGRAVSSEEGGELHPVHRAFTTSSVQTNSPPIDGAFSSKKGGELLPIHRAFTTSSAQTNSPPVEGAVSSGRSGELHPILRAFTTSSAQTDSLFSGEAIASGGCELPHINLRRLTESNTQTNLFSVGMRAICQHDTCIHPSRSPQALQAVSSDVQTGPPISTSNQVLAPSTRVPRIQWYVELLTLICLGRFKSIDTSLSGIHGYIEKARRMAGIVHGVATESAALSFGVIALGLLVLAPIIVSWRLLRIIFG